MRRAAALLLLGWPLAFIPLPARSADFLGPESCRSCHPDAYNAWANTQHAHAKEALSPVQQKDARCLSCHSPNEAEQKVSNITCETCHGGGQYYSPAHVMKDPELARLVGLVDPSENACKSCHDASSPSLSAFNFPEKLKLIDHWSVERQKRAPPQEAPPPGKKR